MVEGSSRPWVVSWHSELVLQHVYHSSASWGMFSFLLRLNPVSWVKPALFFCKQFSMLKHGIEDI